MTIQTANKFPLHEEIYEKMLELFKGNVNSPYQHNRESLDDLIADLEQYRRTLPTADEYLANGVL